MKNHFLDLTLFIAKWAWSSIFVFIWLRSIGWFDDPGITVPTIVLLIFLVIAVSTTAIISLVFFFGDKHDSQANRPAEE